MDLKDVQTLGEIIRITVDAGNASYGYDQNHYLFDTDMRLIDAYRKYYDDTFPVSGIGAYYCYIPLPFKAGDIVKCESPYHETYYGVFRVTGRSRRIDMGYQCMRHWIHIMQKRSVLKFQTILRFLNSQSARMMNYRKIREYLR